MTDEQIWVVPDEPVGETCPKCETARSTDFYAVPSIGFGLDYRQFILGVCTPCQVRHHEAILDGSLFGNLDVIVNGVARDETVRRLEVLRDLLPAGYTPPPPPTPKIGWFAAAIKWLRRG